jgi:hypothetical protein
VGEFNFGPEYGRLNFAQVFQQPDTTNAVNGGYIEPDPGECSGVEGYKALPDFQFIQAIIDAFVLCLQPNARRLIQVVVFAEVVFAEDLIYRLASVAAKAFIAQPQRLFASLAAMVANYPGTDRDINSHLRAIKL